MHPSPATTDTEEEPMEEPVYSSDDEALAAELAAELASEDEEDDSVRLARMLQQEEDAALAAELAREREPIRRATGNVQLSHMPVEIVARIMSFCTNASLLSLRAAETAALAAEGETVTLEGVAAMVWGQRTEPPSTSRQFSSGASSSSSLSSSGSTCADGGADAPSSDALLAVAASIEAALVGVGNRYRSKCRQLLFNLADPKNPRLRQRLVSGQLDAAVLVQLSAAEMASVELQSQRMAWKQNALQRVVKPDWRVGGFVCDLYRCASCDSYQTKLHRTIRAGKRAVDEVSTLYATCIACSARWAVDQA